MTKQRVFIAEMLAPIAETLDAALMWLDAKRFVRPGDKVFLKPNLTWRIPTLGVTTTPAFIAGVAERLRSLTPHIMIGEANGGYHSFSAEEAFQTHGLYELARRLNIGVVNLSQVPCEFVGASVAGREVALELPSLLLHEVDVFITLPVPKVHAMTRVSLGFKNQWGCQPGTMRLRNHPEFEWKVLAINRVLRPRLALYDGTYFLDKTGPMIGQPVRMNLLVAADDVGAGDLTCCEIMGVQPRSVRHLRLAWRDGMMPASLNDVAVNRDVKPFKTHQFRLKRSLIQYIALTAFHSRFGTRLFYDSTAAEPIHRVLYVIRKNPLIGRLLYGPTGPPATEGHR